MLPSPWLSARITKLMYLIEITIIKDQRISDRTPSTLAGVGSIPWLEWKDSRMAYMGLVPMSLKTTPRAARESVIRYRPSAGSRPVALEVIPRPRP